MEAAAAVLEERGLEAATMAEIAARADARIGSLYRFFPSKDALADALMRHYSDLLRAEWSTILARTAGLSPAELADSLIDLLVRVHPQTRAFAALLDARSDWTAIRLTLRAEALSSIRSILLLRAPHLPQSAAEDIAVIVLNNMKMLVAMTWKDAPASSGSPDELRLMNRLYLSHRLRPPGMS